MNNPIHSAAIGVNNVRFFLAPVGGPRLPWVSFDDLLRCASIPCRKRLTFLAMAAKLDEDHVAEILTDTDLTTIVSHSNALGFIAAMRDVGQISPAVQDSFYSASSEAVLVITSDLSSRGLQVFSGEALAKEGRGG